MRVSIKIQPCEQDSFSHHRDLHSHQRPSSTRQEGRRSRPRRSKSEERVVEIQPKEFEPPASHYIPGYQLSPSPTRRQIQKKSPGKYIHSSQARSHSDCRKQQRGGKKILYPSRPSNFINFEAICTPSSLSSSSSNTFSITSNVDPPNFRVIKREPCITLHHQSIETERVMRAKPMSPRVVIEFREPKELPHGRRSRRHDQQPKPIMYEKQYPKPKLPSSSRAGFERKQTSSSSSDEPVFYVVHKVDERPDIRKMEKQCAKKSRHKKYEGRFTVVES
ncbi:unnamed protein product [Hymenolepis diminuta]|uniref:Uncharacterized protein n=1 Tax=Hymenolepis diminuta TaxID=6216 RepID=A0A0R3SF85_HYMDI|nr:unnamed protein product [Hymenolepis diminuta]VUZ52986.1 unnamed protein product [Hymenolepis diminuta]